MWKTYCDAARLPFIPGIPSETGDSARSEDVQVNAGTTTIARSLIILLGEISQISFLL